MSNFIPAESVKYKFVLREIICFFITKRNTVLLDNDFKFKLKELNDHLEKRKNAKITDERLLDYLKTISNYKQRNDKGNIIRPEKKLLSFTPKNKTKGIITIKDGMTQYLDNALRFIDVYMELNKRPDDFIDKTLFGQTQNRKLTFLDKTGGVLGNKEYGIFTYLKNHFNKECDYKELFEAANNMRIGGGGSIYSKYASANQRKEYINQGINSLRRKLYTISGNPNTIYTKKGRISTYTLKY